MSYKPSQEKNGFIAHLRRVSLLTSLLYILYLLEFCGHVLDLPVKWLSRPNSASVMVERSHTLYVCEPRRGLTRNVLMDVKSKRTMKRSGTESYGGVLTKKVEQ
jgi:hypothetical protein